VRGLVGRRPWAWAYSPRTPRPRGIRGCRCCCRRLVGCGGQQGISPQFRLFPGVLVGPPPTFASAIKFHQKSTSNSAGSSVGSLALSTPPGHPTAGRCVRVVPVPPLLLCTRPARARPSIGGQSSTPAPRQLPWPVESSPGLVLSSAVTGDFEQFAISSLDSPKRDWDFRSAGGAQC
jgi:hypothetical protein